MTDDFVAEILRATHTLRSGDSAGATAVIQAALAAGGMAAAAARADGGASTGPAGPPRGSRSRRALGEVVRILAEGRRKLRPHPLGTTADGAARAPDPEVMEGAEFRNLHYSDAAGGRRYRLYVPASRGAGLQGLVVMLHGCTQTPEDFAVGTGMNALAEEHRLLVVYPGQTGSDNSMSCWNWFRPGDQMREVGEPAIIAGLTCNVRAAFGIADDRVFVAGLSAGGAMAAILGETHPDVFSAIGIHSGLAHGSASDVATAFSAMRGQAAPGHPGAERPASAKSGPRVIVFHGSADTTVHPVNAARIVARQGDRSAQASRSEHAPADGRRGYTRMTAVRGDGVPAMECWMVDGAPHAWSGGHPGGTYTDPRGPDASAKMIRFFLAQASRSPGH